MTDHAALDYKTLFESLPNAYIIFAADDPVFTIVAENQAHGDIAFMNPANAIGRPLFDVFPDTSEKYEKTGVSDLLESFRKVIRTKEPDSMPLLHYDLKDEHGALVERWWRLTHYPVFDGAGVVIAVCQSTEDITNEVLAKAKFELARSQLDSALAVGLVSTWSFDITNNIVTGDKNLAKSFGVDEKDAARGLPLSIFINSIHHEDRKKVSDAFVQTIKNRGVFEEEYRTITRNGSIRWVIARGTVEDDASTGKPYFLGILMDTTDRKEAEAALEQTKSMFDALFNSKILGIAMADLTGNILQANDTFLKTLGYTKKDMQRGINSSQLTPPQSVTLTERIYDSLRTKGEIEPVEKEYVKKDGTIIPILVGAAVLPRNPNLFIAYMLDISENRKLKALNVAKDEFIALASHQLRTPATAVKQYLNILIDEYAGPVSPDQLQYLNVANNSNERQLTIINDLLKTAQLDTKGFKLRLDTVDINAVIQEITEQFEPMIDAKNQKIEFKPGAKVPPVRLDSNEFKIAIINIIENASKYSAAWKKISIHTVGKKDSVTIIIKDEGVGIAKADQDSIFEKFTRINNPLSDTVNGSGLGLYWVKRIVNLHGGTLRIHSEVNKGTTFTVSLPL